MSVYDYKDLRKLEDEVVKAKEENLQAKEYIIKFFEPFTIKMSKTTFIPGMNENDIKQSLILYLLIAIRRYSGENKFFWYAIQTMKNNIYQELKRRKKEYITVNIDKISIADEVYIEDNILNNEEFSELKGAISKLKKVDSELIYKLYFENCSYDELSKYFNQSYSAITTRKSRALKRLRILI